MTNDTNVEEQRIEAIALLLSGVTAAYSLDFQKAISLMQIAVDMFEETGDLEKIRQRSKLHQNKKLDMQEIEKAARYLKHLSLMDKKLTEEYPDLRALLWDGAENL